MRQLFSFHEIEQALNETFRGVSARDGVSSVKTDSRKECSGAIFIALAGENFDGHNFLKDVEAAGAVALCVNKKFAKNYKSGFKIPVIAVDDTFKAYMNLANFHRKRLKNIKITAVTGSSGKTSTKEILKCIYKEHFGQEHVYATAGNTNNHIGVPWNILNLTKKHKVCILEMGTNHHGEIAALAKTAEPDIGIITMIGQSHLEFLKSPKGVAKEKASLFKNMKKGGTAVFPVDTLYTEILEKAAKGLDVIRYGSGKNASVKLKYLGSSLKKSSFDLERTRSGEKISVDWSLAGKHQAMNACAAACAAVSMGIGLETVSAGLSKCSLPGMRMKITSHKGVTWINDAYNANPDSMISALSWLSEFADYSKLIIVLGDMLELGETAAEAHLKILRFAAKQFNEAKIVVVGERMIEASSDSDFKNADNIISFSSSSKATENIRKMAKKGFTVFLKASRGIKLEKIEPA